MAQLPKQYRTADLPDTVSSAHIPAGTYKSVIVKSEMKENSKRTGYYLELTEVITEGQFKETELVERLNLVNENSTAQEISYRTLARISEAVGMDTTPQDSVQLHNKPHFIIVADEVGKEWTDDSGVKCEGKTRSIIKKYLPLPAAGVGGFPGASPSVTPFNAAPQAINPAPQSGAAAAPWAASK